MSKGKEDGTLPYAVGYGKPPQHGKFAKGKSGNPSGRPKRAKRAESSAVEFAELSRLFEEEGQRLVTLTENGRPIEMTALRAVARAATVAAIKGDRQAQRTMLNLHQKLEVDKRRRSDDAITDMMTYKFEHPRVVSFAAENGITLPFLPHPDDFKLDRETGEPIVDGPVTQAEHDRMLTAIKVRDVLLTSIEQFDNIDRWGELRNEIDEWIWERHIAVDWMNAHLPERCRRQSTSLVLADRLHAPEGNFDLIVFGLLKGISPSFREALSSDPIKLSTFARAANPFARSDRMPEINWSMRHVLCVPLNGIQFERVRYHLAKMRVSGRVASALAAIADDKGLSTGVRYLAQSASLDLDEGSDPIKIRDRFCTAVKMEDMGAAIRL